MAPALPTEAVFSANLAFLVFQEMNLVLLTVLSVPPGLSKSKAVLRYRIAGNSTTAALARVIKPAPGVPLRMHAQLMLMRSLETAEALYLSFLVPIHSQPTTSSSVMSSFLLILPSEEAH